MHQHLPGDILNIKKFLFKTSNLIFLEHVQLLTLTVIFLSQLSGGNHKKNGEPVTATISTMNYDSMRDETAETCLEHDALSDDCIENKVIN